MNFSYTENPSYLDLGVGIYKAVRWHYRPDNWVNYSFPSSFFADFKKYYYFPFEETLPIFYWSVIFTVARYIFESFVCRPLTRILKLNNKSDIQKFPESFWKFVAYSFLWSNCSYLLLFSQKHDYFTNPYGIWDDWEAGMAVPYDVKFLYFIECGFYLHSIYATIYMDAVRKDFVVMLVHHVLTITLISISYATRYHKIGVLVIFVHDVTDILLEFTKCNVYLKNRGGKFYPFHEHLSNIGFASFAFAWFLFRLYWYPLKILYSSGVVAVHRAYFRGAGLYAFFNSLLWILLLMDIYWFYFIVLFLYKVATGQLSEISDTRELEEEEAAAAAMRAKNGEKVKKEE